MASFCFFKDEYGYRDAEYSFDATGSYQTVIPPIVGDYISFHKNGVTYHGKVIHRVIEFRNMSQTMIIVYEEVTREEAIGEHQEIRCGQKPKGMR